VKRPAFQFYPADWRKDVELQSCSMAAQGLWINAMCLAHECEPYGHLVVNGKGMTAAQIGRHVGLSAKEAQTLLDELLGAGVARQNSEGVIFSKRMVEDEDLRNRRAEGGKAGSEHGAKGAEHGSMGGRPKIDRGDKKPPLVPTIKPPPSSSSSSSPSGNTPPTSSGPPADAVDPSKPLTASDLAAEGVDETLAADWLRVRRAKKAPLTRTAWDGVKREAAKAGLQVPEAVRIAVERGWQGFQAQWVLGDKRPGAANATADDAFWATVK
jgi:hypothetical protein